MALQTKREIAEQLLREMFAAEPRIKIADAVKRGKDQGISRSTLRRAATDIGVREIHNGPFGALWEKT